MPSILSKILMPEWNVPYNCYELGHTWTPYCTEAALEIGLIVFIQSLKLYTPLYLGHQIISRKFDRQSFKESFRSIIRSSVFLGINCLLVILIFCYSRHVLGRFYYTLCAYLPSFVGSVFAILNERPSRRRALAFYVANIASETMFRILLSRGYIGEIPNGKYLMFTSSIAILIFLYETNLLQDPLIKFVFHLLIGTKRSTSISNNNPEISSEEYLINKKMSVWQKFQTKVREIWILVKNQFPILNARHKACLHGAQSSCFERIVFQSFLKSFMLGWFSQISFAAISKLMAGRVKESFQIFRPEQMFSARNMSFTLFLSSFTTIYNSSQCLLCHTTNSREQWHPIMSTLLASPTIFLAPSTSMTLYLLWKSIEALFNYGIKKGYIQYGQYIIPLLYAAACSQIFYAAILEPSFVKPSYRKFIDRITQNRLKYINRNVLEVFGTNASKGFESFLPKYDLKHTTRRFQESVLVWLL